MTRLGETCLVVLVILGAVGAIKESRREDQAEQWRQVKVITGEDPRGSELAPESPAEYMANRAVWFRAIADGALQEYRQDGGLKAYNAFMEAAERAYLAAHWRPHMTPRNPGR